MQQFFILQILLDIIRLILFLQNLYKILTLNNFIYLCMISQKQQFTDIFKKNYGKRNFSKYFTQRKKEILNSQRQDIQNVQILDSISRTSSIRVNQKFLHNPKKKKKENPFSFDLIKNEADQIQNENEFLQNLIKNQINGYKKLKNISSSLSKRYKLKSHSEKQQKIESIIKVYKSNNYIQYPAYSSQKSKGKLSSHINSEASYRSAQKIRKQHSMYIKKTQKIDLTAKGSQDSTFFKPEQNPKRIILFRKTFSIIQKGIFYSIQISSLKNRIIIFSDVVQVKKPNKFRLIMNPQDTKFFNSRWKKNIQEFVGRCIKVDTQNGIILNRPSFLRDSSESMGAICKKSKVEMMFTTRKEQNFVKIGSIGMTNQYSARENISKSKQVVRNISLNREISIQKDLNEKSLKIINRDNLNINLSQIMEEQSRQIVSKSIPPQQSNGLNNSKLEISQNFDNSHIIKSKVQNKSEIQKELGLNISQKFQKINEITGDKSQIIQNNQNAQKYNQNSNQNI